MKWFYISRKTITSSYYLHLTAVLIYLLGVDIGYTDDYDVPKSGILATWKCHGVKPIGNYWHCWNIRILATFFSLAALAVVQIPSQQDLDFVDVWLHKCDGSRTEAKTIKWQLVENI